MNAPIPSKLEIKAQSALLSIGYSNGEEYELSFEFLRVFSPSAEVRGHGNEVLQYGKKDVRINHIEAVGNYAIKISFSDGHDSGIYSWDTLLEYSQNRDEMWQDYLSKLEQANKSR